MAEREYWIENPPRKRKRRKGSAKRRRKPPKGFRTWKAYMASIRPGGTKRKRRRKHTKRTHTRRAAVAHRRKRRGHRRSTHRRRGFRRNPGFRLGGITSTLKAGLMDGAFGVVGKVVARSVPGFIGLPRTGIVGVAVQAVVGAVVLPLLPIGNKRALVQGAMQGALESAALTFGAGVPFIRNTLGSYADELTGMGALPGGPETESVPLISAGDFDEEGAGVQM